MLYQTEQAPPLHRRAGCLADDPAQGSPAQFVFLTARPKIFAIQYDLTAEHFFPKDLYVAKSIIVAVRFENGHRQIKYKRRMQLVFRDSFRVKNKKLLEAM